MINQKGYFTYDKNIEKFFKSIFLEGDYVELRLVNKYSYKYHIRFDNKFYKNLKELVNKNNNLSKYNIYYYPHPKLKIKNKYEYNRFKCFFVDIDFKDFNSKEDYNTHINKLYNKLEKMNLTPTAIVNSGGGGVHLYWILKNSLPYYDEISINSKNRWQIITEQLIKLCSGDKNCKDRKRVMRLPNSLNLKYDNIAVCSIDEYTGKLYKVRDFDGLFEIGYEKEKEICKKLEEANQRFNSYKNTNNEVIRDAVIKVLEEYGAGRFDNYYDYLRLALAFRSEDLPYEDLDRILINSDNYNYENNKKHYNKLRKGGITFGTAFYYAKEVNSNYLSELIKEINNNKANNKAIQQNNFISKYKNITKDRILENITIYKKNIKSDKNILDLLRNGSSCIISATTGAGKTYSTAQYLIERWQQNKKSIYIAESKDSLLTMANQLGKALLKKNIDNVDEISAIEDYKKAKIAIVQGSHNKLRSNINYNDDLIVLTHHKYSGRRGESIEFFKQIPNYLEHNKGKVEVIVDEAHAFVDSQLKTYDLSCKFQKVGDSFVMVSKCPKFAKNGSCDSCIDYMNLPRAVEINAKYKTEYLQIQRPCSDDLRDIDKFDNRNNIKKIMNYFRDFEYEDVEDSEKNIVVRFLKKKKDSGYYSIINDNCTDPHSDDKFSKLIKTQLNNAYNIVISRQYPSCAGKEIALYDKSPYVINQHLRGHDDRLTKKIFTDEESKLYNIADISNKKKNNTTEDEYSEEDIKYPYYACGIERLSFYDVEFMNYVFRNAKKTVFLSATLEKKSTKAKVIADTYKEITGKEIEHHTVKSDKKFVKNLNVYIVDINKTMKTLITKNNYKFLRTLLAKKSKIIICSDTIDNSEDVYETLTDDTIDSQYNIEMYSGYKKVEKKRLIRNETGDYTKENFRNSKVNYEDVDILLSHSRSNIMTGQNLPKFDNILVSTSHTSVVNIPKDIDATLKDGLVRSSVEAIVQNAGRILRKEEDGEIQDKNIYIFSPYFISTTEDIEKLIELSGWRDIVEGELRVKVIKFEENLDICVNSYPLMEFEILTEQEIATKRAEDWHKKTGRYNKMSKEEKQQRKLDEAREKILRMKAEGVSRNEARGKINRRNPYIIRIFNDIYQAD